MSDQQPKVALKPTESNGTEDANLTTESNGAQDANLTTKSKRRKGRPVPELPYLPPEIWTMILGANNNIAHLWIDCKLVSKEFRAYTETTFIQYVLPHTQLAVTYRHSDEDMVTKENRLDFKRIEKNEDVEIAIFEIQPETKQF